MNRILSLAALVLLAHPVAIAVQSDSDARKAHTDHYWRTIAQLNAQASSRHADMTAELQEIGEHPWAGVYRMGSRESLVLRLAPTAGYTLINESSCGNCGGWRGAGKIVGSDDGPNLYLRVELGLEPHPDLSLDSYYGMESILHLVRWGELLFAVPPRSMELFCAQISDGFSFPSVPFRYLGKYAAFDLDRAPRQEGDPSIPDQYRHLLLKAPKRGRIQALVELKEHTGLALPWGPTHDAIYCMDAGAEEGLCVGMRFYLEGDEDLLARGRVEQVDSKTSRVVFQFEKDRLEQAKTMVGHWATTLHPMANQEAR